MGLLARVIERVEDAIERVGRTRDDLHGSLRHAVARASELALDVHRLQDRIDELERDRQELEDQVGRLRFNGPTLYRDEVEGLESLATKLVLRINTELSTDLEQDRRLLNMIRGLIERCDPMPSTVQEMERTMEPFRNALRGTVNPPETVTLSSNYICRVPMCGESGLCSECRRRRGGAA